MTEQPRDELHGITMSTHKRTEDREDMPISRYPEVIWVQIGDFELHHYLNVSIATSEQLAWVLHNTLSAYRRHVEAKV